MNSNFEENIIHKARIVIDKQLEEPSQYLLKYVSKFIEP